MAISLVSVSGAARQLGISRRTIQRAVDKSLLKKHGTRQAGQHAAQLDLEEVRRVCVLSQSRHGVRRARMAPVWQQVKQFLEEQKFDPAQVLGVYMRACLAQADIDFLLYCIERLREGNAYFVSMVMGHKVNPLMVEPLCAYAAKRLSEIAATQNVGLPRGDFRHLWSGLAALCVQAPVDAEPAIVHDRVSNTAELLLTPRWVNGAPSGMLPIVGGKQSVAHVGRVQGQERVADVTTKLVHCLQKKEEAGEKMWPWVASVLADDSSLCTFTHAEPDATADTTLKEAAALKEVARAIGLSPFELKLLKRAWRASRGDAASRQTKQFIEDRAQDPAGVSNVKDAGRPHGDTQTNSKTPTGGYRISPSVLASVFGISRRSASRFLLQRGLRRGHHQVVRLRDRQPASLLGSG